MRSRTAVLALAFLLPTSVLSAADTPSPRRDEVVAVVERVKGAVVNIHSERVNPGVEDPYRPGATQPQRVNGMGTGIVLDPRGYIVTNYHVVDDVQSLRVRLVDGTSVPARVIALDKESDLALIKIDPPRPLPTVPLGTAQDLMLGEQVLAIGNAFGYEHTVTVGYVSAMKRDVTLNKEISYKSLIQTQTPINPGNSGGPLFNKLGEVVGVNVAIRAGAQNIAFTIPVDTMIQKAAEMMSVRRRGNLAHGLVVEDLHRRDRDDAPLKRSVRVTRVDAGSPAAEAGVRVGDTLETVADASIATSIDLERALFDKPLGAAVAVRVRRAPGLPPGTGAALVSAAPATADLTLTLQPALAAAATPASELASRKLGVTLYAVGPDTVAKVDAALRGGMLVQDVAANSVAARSGIQKGDILIGLHTYEALNFDNVTWVLTHKDLASFGPLKAYVVRDGGIRAVQLDGVP